MNQEFFNQSEFISESKSKSDTSSRKTNQWFEEVINMLSALKASAASCSSPASSYVRMSDLAPGRYPIRKFSLRDSQYGKRLVIEIEQGFMYLPEKMYKKFNTEKAINKLNKEQYDLVYEGKSDRAPNRLMFTFETHNMADEEYIDGDEYIDEDDNNSEHKDVNGSGFTVKKQKRK